MEALARLQTVASHLLLRPAPAPAVAAAPAAASTGSSLATRLLPRVPTAELDALAASIGDRVDIGFAAKHLESGACYSTNAERRFPPASAIKLPIMIALYKAAADGELDMDASLPIPPGVDHHGTGKLKDEAGTVPPRSLRQYCRLMMEVSDNVATDTIIHALGLGAVNSLLDTWGFDRIRMTMTIGRWHHAILGLANAAAWPIGAAHTVAERARRVDAAQWDDDGPGYSGSLANNVMAARQTMELLELLQTGELASEADTEEMLTWMRNATFANTLGRYLAPGVSLANKHGGSRRIAADCGIISRLPGGGGTVLIAAFALARSRGEDGKKLPGDNWPKAESIEVMAQMAGMFVRSVDPDAVLPILSRTQR